MEYPQAWQPEETYEDPLEVEVPLCMVLKDGRSFTLPGINGDNCQVGGNEAVTLRPRGNEDQMLPLHIIVAGEGEKDKSPWVNKKFLGFCKSVGVSIEGFEEDILRIL